MVVLKFGRKGSVLMNNLRKIREIYGITQEEIAKAINVNRSTISMWEKQDSKPASSSSQEKLSLFYGIGPNFFYEDELDDTAIEILVGNSKKQKEIEEKAKGTRLKTTEFNELFSSITFDDALKQYMNSTKILLATAEDASIEKLELARKIHKKLDIRLDSILNIRLQEEESLAYLLESLNSEE